MLRLFATVAITLAILGLSILTSVRPDDGAAAAVPVRTGGQIDRAA